MLKTVKIVFKDTEILQKALSDNRIRMGHCLHGIEKPHWSKFLPVRCYNCNTFHKTAAKFCENNTKCVHCSGDHNIKDCPVKDDQEAAKCINCKGPHKASYMKCPHFINLCKKINGEVIDLTNGS